MYQYLLLLDTEKEKEFFQKLYETYRHEMFYVANKILKCRADAEDVVHETFLTLIDNLEGMMEAPPHKNWNFILTVLKNKCYNICKRSQWETDSELDEQELAADFEEDMDTRLEKMELEEMLLELIKGLNETYRDVLLLQYYHEKDAIEIAKILGKTPDNVRHISMRAKRKLQRKLEERL